MIINTCHPDGGWQVLVLPLIRDEENNMHWNTYENVELFAEKATPILMQKEAANNLPLGLIDQFLKKGKAEDVLTALIEDENQVLASFMMTPPFHLIITIDQNAPAQKVITLAIEELRRAGISIPSVIGERSIASQFAKAWAELAGVSIETGMEQRVYQLTKVNDIRESLGEHCLAEMNDLPILTNWRQAFIEETEVLTGNMDDGRKAMEQKIKDQSIYIWKVDGKPVTMTARGRQSKNGQVVTLVYTPEEYRGQGYASSLVKKVSEEILKEKKFCTLYTDLANPTSNKIYTNIGYEPVEDSIVLSFS
jgi:uncharacterized protein